MVTKRLLLPRPGCVNYTTMEDISKGEQVLMGTFSLNGCPIVILFDSGATHDFIDKVSTQKCQLTIQHINTPYMISTPGWKIITKQMVLHTPLNLARKVYMPSLIILDGQGIDVILGMGWMKAHKALLDTAAQVVHLESPIHGTDVLQLSLTSVAPPSVHYTTAQRLDDISVAHEFLDVFPDDLSGMPPDRDVEFTIERQLSTTPFSRQLYKMTPKELAELKIQLNELLTKGAFIQVIYLRVVRHYLLIRKINP
jgi:hypothetical protein